MGYKGYCGVCCDFEFHLFSNKFLIVIGDPLIFSVIGLFENSEDNCVGGVRGPEIS